MGPATTGSRAEPSRCVGEAPVPSTTRDAPETPRARATSGSGEVLGPADYVALYEHSPDGVLFTSTEGPVLAANPAACAILAMTEAEICHAGRQGLADPSDPRWAAMLETRRRQGHVNGVARMRRGDGPLIEVEMDAQVFLDGAGHERTCTVIRDVSERVAIEERLRTMTATLRELSMSDELTGLRNRRAAFVLGTQLVELGDRQRREVQVLFVDVDGLKALNDSLGHGAGDDALRAVAEALSSAFRRSDVVARIGGDEFLVVAAGLGEPDRAGLERRIRQSLAATDVAAPGKGVSVSLGWATRPVDDPSPFEAWVSRADRAMYAARDARHQGSHS